MSMNVRSKGKFEFDANYIENCSEIELFIQINGYFQFLEQLKLTDYYHKMYKLYQIQGDKKAANYFKTLEDSMLNRTPTSEELKVLEDTLDFCILQTARFNTGVCDTSNGRIKTTQGFENWYYSWINYIAEMDNESYDLYRRCRYEGKGLECFQLNKPVEIINVENLLTTQKIKKYEYVEAKENIRQKFA